jgi:hypothetical protein
MKSKTRKSTNIEDLTVNKTNAEDVVGGGLSLSYTEIKPTYTPQKDAPEPTK